MNKFAFFHKITRFICSVATGFILVNSGTVLAQEFRNDPRLYSPPTWPVSPPPQIVKTDFSTLQTRLEDLEKNVLELEAKMAELEAKNAPELPTELPPELPPELPVTDSPLEQTEDQIIKVEETSVQTVQAVDIPESIPTEEASNNTLPLIYGLFVVIVGFVFLILFIKRPKKSLISSRRSSSSLKLSDREFFGLYRPDIPELPLALQEQWVKHTERGGAWQTEWENTVKAALNTSQTHQRPQSKNQISLFLLDFWLPLACCHEQDKQQWRSLQQKLSVVCPAPYRVEITVPDLVGKFTSEAINHADKIVGQGEIIQYVIQPTVTLFDAQNKPFAQKKAWLQAG